MRDAVIRLKTFFGSVPVLGGMIWIISGVVSCGTAPTPFVVRGPGPFGNDPPTLTFLEPIDNLTVGQGDPFLIRWTDTDRDDNASIDFRLLETTKTNVDEGIPLVLGLAEDDTAGPDVWTVSTTLIPPNTYNLVAVIDDRVNPRVEQFATVATSPTAERVIITIVGAGEGPQTVPPLVTVTEPAFNLSVAQEDPLTIVVQPAPLAPDPATPYDPDSDVRLFIVLDFDLDPTNDDPANPVKLCSGGTRDGERCTTDADCGDGTCMPEGIIVLIDQNVAAGTFDRIEFSIIVDLAVIRARPDGEPYFIRATVDDSTNPRVHSYAAGTISVVQLAAGTVDLFDIGRTKSGARFQGFNPGARLGSSITHVSDFDADGVDDFVMVAQFGNPQNMGPVGEAYLVYGQGRAVPGSSLLAAGNRFGGIIPVNSVSDTVSGVVFPAPPVRTFFFDLADPPPRTDGITDASFVRDLSGDGRPELLFGLPHVHGAFDSTDYDPGDTDEGLGCYPDILVNNRTDSDSADPPDIQFYSGGMAVMVNSQNRDNDPRPEDQRQARLETTVVNLELVGQWQGNVALGASVIDPLVDPGAVGNIWPRADNEGVSPIGNDPSEAGRIAGARFIAGGYDFEDAFLLRQPPRNGLFGQSVASLGDLNSDGLDEIIISAPRNERYLADVLSTVGFFSTHLQSTVFHGSIVVVPGFNYNREEERDIDDDEGTAQIPFLDQHELPPFGSCTTPVEARHYMLPLDSFEIFAEDIDDMLGGARSAGDFNRDGLDDILCGAPLNDRSPNLPDTGATYIIYGRSVFGDVHLSLADDRVLRPPMLRIRSRRPGDQIGWRQTAGLDVNGDRIDDVFFGSPRADFGGVTRAGCEGDFDGVTGEDDLNLTSFNTCEDRFGEEVFSDDACKVFDYDNDGDIDDDDRCVFCCLSEECEPDSSCVFGRGTDCCENLVDNGFVGIIFGGIFIDGDRDITDNRSTEQLATSQLPGTIFYGACARDRAGFDISSAGDFNKDGYGDILISVPGEVRCDQPIAATCDAAERERLCREAGGRERLGVVYLVFGGTHLINTTWNLKDVGSEELPGIVFLSPYLKGRPNEAAPTTVGFIGDINNDGFGDIAIGNPKADFIDPSFPQGPDAPGSDPATGRRSNVGEVYVVYGNNFGSNRALPP